MEWSFFFFFFKKKRMTQNSNGKFMMITGVEKINLQKMFWNLFPAKEIFLFSKKLHWNWQVRSIKTLSKRHGWGAFIGQHPILWLECVTNEDLLCRKVPSLQVDWNCNWLAYQNWLFLEEPSIKCSMQERNQKKNERQKNSLQDTKTLFPGKPKIPKFLNSVIIPDNYKRAS